MRGKFRELADGGRELTVHFTAADLMCATLDAFDRAQLNEKSEGIADWLLDAELIARRLEQQEARAKENGSDTPQSSASARTADDPRGPND